MVRFDRLLTKSPEALFFPKWALSLLFLVLFQLFLHPAAEAASAYSQVVEVNSTLALTDFQVLLTIDTASLVGAGKMKADGSDIRFYDSDGVTAIPFWIETGSVNTAATKIWIRIPSIPINPPNPRKYIHLRYGDPAATSVADGTGTFLFFDDFSGGLGKWTIHNQSAVGDIAIVSGYLQCGGGSTSGPYGHTVLGSSNTYNSFVDGIIEGSVYGTTNSIAEISFRGNYAANTGYKARWMHTEGESLLKPPYVVGGWAYVTAANGISFPTDEWASFKVVVSSATVKIWRNATLHATADPGVVVPGPGEISLQNHYGTYSRYDDIRVRRLAATEPTTSLATFTTAGSIAILEGVYCSSANVNLALTATDTSGITSMTLRDDAGTTWTGAFQATRTWTIPAAQGTHTVSVSFLNGVSARSATYSATVCLDTASPTGLVVVDSGVFTLSTSTLRVDWNATDTGGGILKYEVGLGTASGVCDIVAYTNYGLATNATFTGLPLVENGTKYYFSVKAYDPLGRIATASSDGIMVDRPPSVVSITLDGTYTPIATSIHAIWTAATDPGSGLNRYEMGIGTATGTTNTVAFTSVGSATTFTLPAALVNGSSYWVTIKAVDNNSNISTSTAGPIRVDNQAPPVPALSTPWTYTVGTSFTATCPAVVDAGIGGVKYAFEQATDVGFTTGLASSGWIAATSWTFPGLVHNQLYYYRVRTQDALGNTSAYSATKSSTQDSLAPVATEFTDNVPGNNDLDETFSADRTLSFAPIALSDPVSGVSNVRVQISRDNFSTLLSNTLVGASGSTTQTLAALAEGDVVKAQAQYIDNVGNVSAWQQTNGIIIDLPPSYVTITLDGVYTNALYTATTTEMHAVWTPSVDPVSNIDHYEYAIGTASGATNIVPWTNCGSLMDVTPTGLSLVHAQTYWFAVKAVNGRTISTVSLASITVDLQPPLAPPVMTALPVYSPTASRTVSCGAIVDPVSLTVQYFFEQCTDGTFATVTASSGWTLTPSYTFGSLSHQTQYWYRVKARDLLYNDTFNHETAFSAPVTTIQDLYPPIASGFTDIISENIDIDPTPGHFGDVYGAFSRDRTISFAPVNMYDDCSGNSNMYVEICRITPVPFPFFTGWASVPAPTFAALLWSGTTGSFATFTVTLPALNDADVVFARVRYIDVAGNWAVVASAQVTDGILIDLPPPGVTVTPDYYINASGTFSATTTQVVTAWTSSIDAGSGIRNYDLAIGTASGDTSIVPWTDVGLLTATTTAGLALAHSQPYWVSVRTWNGNDTPTVTNANFRIDIVEPPIPVMNPLPMYTPGDSCTVSCTSVFDPVSGPVQYRFLRARDATFSTELTYSGWSFSNTYTYGPVPYQEHGQIYFYKVQTRDVCLNTTTFSPEVWTIQDRFAPISTTYTDNIPENSDPNEVYSRDRTVSFAPIDLFDDVSGANNVYVQLASQPTFAAPTFAAWVGLATTTQNVATATYPNGSMVYARARYQDVAGNVSTWTVTNGIKLDTTNPAAVTITLPGPFTATTTSLLSTWTSSSDAESTIHHYEFALGTTSGGTDIIPWTNVGMALSTTTTGLSLVHAQSYWVSIKTVNGALRETINTSPSITCDIVAPPVPVMVALPTFSPGTSRAVQCGPVIDPVSGMETYRFWCATDASFTTGLASSTWSSLASATFSGLVHGQTYYYRVEAQDRVFNICSFSSEVFSTQDALPPTATSFTDNVPENNDPDWVYTRDKTVSFTPVSLFDDVSGVNDVLVQISTSATFIPLLSSAFVGPTGSLTTTLPTLINGNYVYARATYYDLVGNTSTQTTDGIRLDNSAPVAATPILPGSYTATMTSLVASWPASSDGQSGIHHYEFAIGTASGGTDIVSWTNVGLAKVFTATGLSLLNTQLYYVTVKTVNGALWETVKTNSIRIDTDPPPIPTMSPMPTYTPGTTCTASCSTVVDALSGGVTYYLERADDASFTVGLTNSGWLAAPTYTFSPQTHGQLYYFRVKARDLVLNNSSFSAAVSTTQDCNAPTVATYTDNVAANNDPDSNYSRDKIVSFGPVALTDDLSGVADVILQISSNSTFVTGSAQFSIGPTGAYTANLGTSVTDGNNVYARAKFVDIAGNVSGWSQTNGIRIDLTPPTSTSIVINGGSLFTGTTTVSLSLNATDVNGVLLMSFSENGTTWTASEAYATTRSWTVSSGDGLKPVYVRFQDAAGNISPSISASITLDTTAPVGSFTIVEAPYVGTTTVHLSISATDISTTTSIVVQSDGGTTTTFGYQTSLSWDLPNVDATHTVSMSFIDLLGHQSASVSAMICLDRADPTVPLVVDDGLYSGSSTALHATWIATDTGSEIDHYVVGIGTTPGTDNTASFTNLGLLTTNTFSGLTLQAGGATLYYFTVRAYDHVGRFTEGYSDGIHGRDPSPPTTVTITTEGPFTATASVLLASWTASSDPESGIDHYEFGVGTATGTTNVISWTSLGIAYSTIASGLSLLDGQSYWISVKIVNGAMATQTCTALPITVDLSPPPIPVMTALPTFSTGTARLVSCSTVFDPCSGGVKYRFQTAADAGFTVGLSDSGWITATSTTFSGLSHAQTSYYRVQSQDAVLNTSGFSAGVFSTQDLNAPTVATYTDNVAANNDPDSNYSRDKTVSFAPVSLTDDLSGVANVILQISSDSSFLTGSPQFSIGPAGIYTANLATCVLDGNDVFARAKLVDVAGNISGWYQTNGIRIDQTPPGPVSITINSGDAYTATTAITLGLSAADLNGVPLMSFSEDTITWTASEPYATSRSWTVPVGDGLKHVYARFQDSAGNISSTAMASITLDTAVPIGSFTIVEAPYVGTITVHLSLIATSVAPISSMTIRVDGGIGTTVPYLTSIAWNLPNADATHTVEVSFRDLLGKKSASSSAMICVDRFDPTVPLVLDDGLYSGTPTTLHGTWLATDTSSGIKRYVVGIGTSPGTDETASFTDLGLLTDKTFTGLTLDMGGVTMYYFTVRAYDHIGRFTEGCSDGIHGGDPTPPAPVNITTDGTYSPSNTFLHATWTNSSDTESGINHYEFAAGDTNGGTNIVPWTSVGLSNTYTASGLTLLDGQSYWISVKAVNGGMTGQVTTALPITIDISAPPVPVMNALPAYSSGTSIIVSCTSVTDAYSGGVQYDFEEATDAGFSSGLASSGWIVASDYTWTGHTHGQSYFYRVRSRDAVGNISAVSATVQSQQDSNPPTATNFTDNLVGNNDPDDTWTRDTIADFGTVGFADDLSGKKNVYIEVATDTTFANPVYADWVGITGQLSFSYPSGTDGTHLYARAKYEDVAGNISSWSATTDGIGLDLNDPGANGTTDIAGNTDPNETISRDSTIQFNFTHSDSFSGVADVAIQIATDSGFSSVVFQSWIGNCTSYVYSGGVGSSTYYARIQVKDNAGRISASGTPSNGIYIDLSPPIPGVNPPFLINDGDQTTATGNVRLTFHVDDPSGVAEAQVSNDNVTWTTGGSPFLNPALGTGTYTAWALDVSGGAGTKTIYCRFLDGSGVGHLSPTYTQTINYYPGAFIQNGDRDSNIYPINTYDEYNAQNKYGSDRSTATAPASGKSLMLKKP